MRVAAVTLAMATMALVTQAATISGTTNWEYYAGKTPRGTDLCSLSTSVTGTSLRNVSIKQLSNRASVNITLYQEDWKFPQSVNVPFTLDFIDQQPLKLSGYGDGQVVDVELPKADIATFLSLLGNKQEIQFHIGTQPQVWSVPLTGIKPKLKSFVNCALIQNKAESSLKKTTPMPGECKSITFTGLAATRFPYQLEDAMKAQDVEDYIARNPILCNKNNACRGIGYFENKRAQVQNEDGKYLHVIAPVDFTTGRRDIYLAIFRKDARCSPQ